MSGFSERRRRKGKMLNIIAIGLAIVVLLFLMLGVRSFFKNRQQKKADLIFKKSDVVELFDDPVLNISDLDMLEYDYNIKKVKKFKQVEIPTEVEGVSIISMKLNEDTGVLEGLLLTRPIDDEYLRIVPENKDHINDFISGEFTEFY